MLKLERFIQTKIYTRCTQEHNNTIEMIYLPDEFNSGPVILSDEISVVEYGTGETVSSAIDIKIL